MNLKLGAADVPEKPLKKWGVHSGGSTDIVPQTVGLFVGARVPSVRAREEVCAVGRIQACLHVGTKGEGAAVRLAVEAAVDHCAASTRRKLRLLRQGTAEQISASGGVEAVSDVSVASPTANGCLARHIVHAGAGLIDAVGGVRL
jgi:hypothetical protein